MAARRHRGRRRVAHVKFDYSEYSDDSPRTRTSGRHGRAAAAQPRGHFRSRRNASRSAHRGNTDERHSTTTRTMSRALPRVALPVAIARAGRGRGRGRAGGSNTPSGVRQIARGIFNRAAAGILGRGALKRRLARGEPEPWRDAPCEPRTANRDSVDGRPSDGAARLSGRGASANAGAVDGRPSNGPARLPDRGGLAQRL